MSKIFFISDTHFNHQKILIYEPCRIKMTQEYIHTRYFIHKDLEIEAEFSWVLTASSDLILANYKTDEVFMNWFLDLHDQMLVDKWNSVVTDDDIVYHLGDVAMGSGPHVQSIIKSLKGHKILLLGNHDCRDRRMLTIPQINRVRNTINKFIDLGFEDVKARPFDLLGGFYLSHEPKEYINENFPFFNIYGHVHGSPTFPTVTKFSRCVCVERTDGYPIEVPEFNAYLNLDLDRSKV